MSELINAIILEASYQNWVSYCHEQNFNVELAETLLQLLSGQSPRAMFLARIKKEAQGPASSNVFVTAARRIFWS